MKETLRKILLENCNKENYMRYIGIRGVNRPLELGKELGTSYLWDEENDISTYETDDSVELGGVCCINALPEDWENWSEYIYFAEDYNLDEIIDLIIERLDILKKGYSYRHYYLIMSNNRNPLGMPENDDFEIILADAVAVMEL